MSCMRPRTDERSSSADELPWCFMRRRLGRVDPLPSEPSEPSEPCEPCDGCVSEPPEVMDREPGDMAPWRARMRDSRALISSGTLDSDSDGGSMSTGIVRGPSLSFAMGWPSK